MSQSVGFTRKVLFRLRWAVMSRERRYACLWARTRRGRSLPGAGLPTVNE